MLTFKIWYDSEPDIPSFKRLSWKIVDVDVADVLERGIHPWGDRHTCRTLVDRLRQLINDNKFVLPELKDLGYGESASVYPHYCHGERNQFEDLLDSINRSIRFVDSLDFQRILEITEEQLLERWKHDLVVRLLKRIYFNFNDLRSFIKSKNQDIKLSSYEDLDNYDLSRVLTLKDFAGEDKVLIEEGLPVTNFRSATFLKDITDSDGLLRLTQAIDYFELRSPNGNAGYGDLQLVYHGERKGRHVILRPSLGNTADARELAQTVASRWRTDDGIYCFRTSIQKLSDMLSEGNMEIRFPGLNYSDKQPPTTSTAHFRESHLNRFRIGKFATARCSGDTIRSILRNHSVSMTGAKDVLVEKLAKLASQQYHKHFGEMGNFFQKNKFVKISAGGSGDAQTFPILRDVELRNLLLAMYALRHLRGNAILDGNYDNETVELVPLARSLVNEDVSLGDHFISVQR